MKRVLITGATGFLGSAVARACEAAGLAVQTTGRSSQPVNAPPNYRAADLGDCAAIEPLVQGVECVIHVAGLAHQFRAGRHDRPAFIAGNVEATANVVGAAAAAGIAHVVLVSSVSVYGGSAANEDVPCRPHGPYAESKYLAEQGAIELAERHGIRLTILRMATIYGEGDPGNMARLMRTIDRGRFIWIGTGANQKSLIYRDDAARACVAAAQSRGSGTSVYNVSAPPAAMRAVVSELAAALGQRVPRWHIPAGLVLSGTGLLARISGGRGALGRLPLTAQKWLADDIYPALRFEQQFAFQPEVTLSEGLRREVAWYRRQVQ